MDLPLPPGTKLAGFTIIDEIARGGFGITYRATDSTGTVVALKEYFPAELAERAGDLMVQPRPDQRRLYFEGLRAFLSEANTLKSLPQKLGLVRVRSAFEKFGTAYCAMEYIEGEPLSRLVPRVQHRHGHVPEDLLRDLIGPICLALEAVHSCGLVHRDVKPANLFLAQRAEQAVRRARDADHAGALEVEQRDLLVLAERGDVFGCRLSGLRTGAGERQRRVHLVPAERPVRIHERAAALLLHLIEEERIKIARAQIGEDVLGVLRGAVAGEQRKAGGDAAGERLAGGAKPVRTGSGRADHGAVSV